METGAYQKVTKSYCQLTFIKWVPGFVKYYLKKLSTCYQKVTKHSQSNSITVYRMVFARKNQAEHAWVVKGSLSVSTNGGNPQIINFKGTLHHKPAGLWHGHPSTLCHGSQTHAFPSELFRIQVWTQKISQTHLTSLQGTSLRDEYNKYLANAMADLRLCHPSWLGHEVIAKAREMSGPYIIVIPLLRCVIS